MVKISLSVPQGWTKDLPSPNNEVSVSAIDEFCTFSESIGVDSLFVGDHLLPEPRWIEFRRQSILEGWTLLTHVSGVTKRIRLGSLVLCASYRNPGLLAKMGASLDVLSNGRLTLGLGAGWHEPEFASFGYDISTPARVAKLRESLEIISRLWAGDDVTYDGKYYKVANASCYPKPKQKPHPPLLVAGDGPKLLQLAARYADVYTTSSYATSSPDQCRERFEELKTCCLKVGRDYDDIRKAYHFQVLLSRDDKELNKVIDAIKPGHLSSKEFIATHPEKLKPMKADQFVKFLKGFRDVGVDEFIVYMEGYAVHRESLMILKGLMEEIKAL